MTVDELNDWYTYRNKRLLPHRRFEYYLAQLTLHTARASGGEYRLRDFLFDEKETVPEDTTDTGAAVIGAITGGIKVIKLGQKRKKSG